jgi:undecaprenyl-diphosphatase
MLEQLIHYDQELFLLINQVFSNPFFDWLMPILRNPYTWAPLYLFLIIFLIRNYKKKGIVMLVFFIMTFGIADSTSSSLIKPEVMRIRPCNDVLFKDQVKLRVRCGSGYSFPSSHATNHFALGMFLLVIFRKRWKPIIWLSLGWAASISFAQIYVGVHYPIDILMGALLGSIIGILTASIFLYFQPNQPTVNG